MIDLSPMLSYTIFDVKILVDNIIGSIGFTSLEKPVYKLRGWGGVGGCPEILVT